MNGEWAHPPRIAEMLLRSLLRPHDAQSLAGDRLEEYRAVRRPSLGRFKADAWYWRQVLGVLAGLVWPFALALVASRVVLAVATPFPLSGAWNPSLVPAPNVSLIDALFFLAAGYSGARRTERFATGVIYATALGFIEFATFAVLATLRFPTLPAAMWRNPFILLIGCVFLAVAVTFAVSFGAAGATAGQWTARRASSLIPGSG